MSMSFRMPSEIYNNNTGERKTGKHQKGENVRQREERKKKKQKKERKRKSHQSAILFYPKIKKNLYLRIIINNNQNLFTYLKLGRNCHTKRLVYYMY